MKDLQPRGSRRRRIHPFRWRLEAALLQFDLGLARVLPERVGLALAAGLGRWTAGTDLRVIERSRANASVAFPDWSDAQRLAMLRASYAELGRNAILWARLPALSADELAAKIEWRGSEIVEGALARGKGAMVVTAHFGAWEIVPVAGRLQFPDHEITAVARTVPNPHVQSVISGYRGLFGGHTLPQEARAILKALRRNAAVGVLVDQYLSRRRGGILVPFMGKRTWTNPGPATLALRTGAAVFPIHARLKPEGGYRIEVGPEFEMPATGDRRADIVALMTRINEFFEALIRSSPELWLWGHRRWHHSPDAQRLYAPRTKRHRPGPRRHISSARRARNRGRDE